MRWIARGTFGAWAIAVVVCVAMPQAGTQRRAPANRTTGCIGQFDPATDYFPDKAKLESATTFSVRYERSYKVVSVNESYPGGPPERYALVQCGAPPPPLTGDLAGAQLVTVPIASLFVLSPTHLSLLADLDRIGVLAGVARRNMVTDRDVVRKIDAGAVVEFAKGGALLDVERVVASKPSLVMSGGTSNATFAVLRNAGIPVAADTEWLEPTALGRAEWLKFMALFLNEERKAQERYGAMRDRYRALSARAVALPEAEQPLVMTGRSTRGLFVIAGGRSYVASLIRDAGARYAWADNTAVGTATVDLEAQIQRAAGADIWINGGGWKNLAAMLDDEPRYRAFKAYRTGQVWVYERRETSSGGNDYWSRSAMRPDLVLADLVRIFHPRLNPDHELEWYMPVAAGGQ
ncbi:MAG TPA: ABC transporter substrate-binding protein [Vicinamibacterales bacterium]|nr:ABC transporter substrate-binding protein [Vicinamibacterales bacterium]